ncbi:MAG: hypothetical protein AB8F74_18240 [Saprospiraceae bacterium]
MLYKIKLKNSSQEVIVDDKVYKLLTTDPHLKKIDLINNLRLHSSGCAVFQKTHSQKKGGYKTETIYLHKLVAEKFHKKNRKGKNKLVGAKNGNKLDCRVDNINYRSRATASRQRSTSSKTGYTGVYEENGRYRAVISIKRKSVHIGMFKTAAAAAKAYNEKSMELYGDEGKLNPIGKHKPKKEKLGKMTAVPLVKKEKAPAAKKITKKAAPKKRATTAKKTTAKKTTTRKPAAKKTVKKAAPKKKATTAKKTTAKKATKRAAPKKKTVAKKAAPKKKATAKKAAPKKKTVAKKTTAKKTTSRKKK